jgi:hypothetical protein
MDDVGKESIGHRGQEQFGSQIGSQRKTVHFAQESPEVIPGPKAYADRVQENQESPFAGLMRGKSIR